MKRPESYTQAATRPPHHPGRPPLPAPGGSIRSRRWERNPRNKGFTYRVGQDIDDLLTQAVAEMAEMGWICTKSQMARAWLDAGHELWEQRLVEVKGYERLAGTSRRKE